MHKNFKRRYKYNRLSLTSFSMCDFIAQLIIALSLYLGGLGSNPVETRIFFKASFLQFSKQVKITFRTSCYEVSW